MKKLLLLPVLSLMTGCATYVGVEQPVSPTPVYPPMYDTRVLKVNIATGLQEAYRLKKFTYTDNNLMRLDWALDAYINANKNLQNALYICNTATLSYNDWQVQ